MTMSKAAKSSLPPAPSTARWKATSAVRKASTSPFLPLERIRAASPMISSAASAGACCAASPAASGSMATRSSVSERSCRAGASVIRQRMTSGSSSVHSSMASTTSPTRRIGRSMPSDSITRTTSRTTDRDTSYRVLSSSALMIVPGASRPATMS